VVLYIISTPIGDRVDPDMWKSGQLDAGKSGIRKLKNKKPDCKEKLYL
jgi:hypothetical protein